MQESKRKVKGACQYKHWNYKCDRSLYDKDHCIFHSQDTEGKRETFREIFWEEFDRQEKEEKEYDFSGFVFPNNISFQKRTFKKDIYFCSSKFFKKADFKGAEFLGRMDFNDAEFRDIADFSLITSHKFSDFGSVEFVKDTTFTGAQFFENTSFNLKRYNGKVFFREAKFYKRVEFQMHAYKDEDVNNLFFEYTYFFNVRGLFEFIESNRKKFKYSKKLKLKFLPDNFKLILGEEATARYPETSRIIKDDMYLLEYQKKHKCIFKAWWLFADCGRSFLKWASWSIGVVLIFAFIYLFIGPSGFKPKVEGYTSFSFFYYSIVTFTTLGFGDITPIKWFTEILVTIEVILGYIMLGGLISIFANKLARRS